MCVLYVCLYVTKIRDGVRASGTEVKDVYEPSRGISERHSHPQEKQLGLKFLSILPLFLFYFFNIFVQMEASPQRLASIYTQSLERLGVWMEASLQTLATIYPKSL